MRSSYRYNLYYNEYVKLNPPSTLLGKVRAFACTDI